MRILVCGGRDYSDYNRFEQVLHWFSNIKGLCHGGAKGADSMTHRYMQENFQVSGCDGLWTIEYQVFPANWEQHGKSAGILRNIEMFDTFKPDLVIAFPGGRGTAHMISYAKTKNCSVLEVK